MGYEFDSTAIYSYYFILSILVLYITIATYFALKPLFATKKTIAHVPNSSLCVAKTARLAAKKKGPAFSVRRIIYVLAVVLAAFLAFLIATHEGEEVKHWNPYEVLQVREGAPIREIKSAFRSWAVRLEPYRPLPPGSLEKLVECHKAYATLTNPEMRKNWEEFGNPDGRQSISLGIGLLSWIDEKGNAWMVLSACIGGFGVVLPMLVGRWWSKSKMYTEDKSLQDTMQHHFTEITETTTTKKLIDVLAASNDFVEDLNVVPAEADAIKQVEKDVKDALSARNEEYRRPEKPTSAGFVKAHVLLHAHLLRVPVADVSLSKDKDYVVEKAAHLVLGALEISIARNWPVASQSYMELCQLIIQAVWVNDPQIATLPHITYDIVKKMKSFKPPRFATQLLALDEKDRNSLLSGLSSEQILDVVLTANNIPRIQIVSARFKVPGESVVAAGSLVSFEAQFKLVYGANATNPATESNVNVDIAPADEADKPSKKNAEEKWPCWWIMLVELHNGKLVCAPVKVTQSSTDAEPVVGSFHFQSPTRPGVYPLALWARCDSFVGADYNVELKMVVVEPPHSQ